MAALKVHGTVRVPGDKSISHRALMVAALAEGDSVVRDVLISEDVAATASVLRGMGASIPPLAPVMPITGCGLRGLHAPGSPLDCGNSGTTARLTAGIVAGHRFEATFTGDDSLSRRPMDRVARPLEAMGAKVTLTNGRVLPMTVEGGDLRDVAWTLETPSAQVKSAILLAALNANVAATIRGDAGSRDHTERLLAFLGVDVRQGDDDVTIGASEPFGGFDLAVPADPSSGAYLAALAALADSAALSLTDVCLNPRRDGFIDALARMGARIETHDQTRPGPEPVGTITVRTAELHGLDVGGYQVTRMIDELPLFACVASRADGTSTVTGAAELRVKESDRIHAVVSNLRAIGADAEELPDGFVVHGSRKPLRGTVATRGDHRIAMSFGVLAALPRNEIQIDAPDCVAISYPGFWDDLRRLTT